MTRVYLPCTLPRLRAALRSGSVDAPVAYAVTPALREWYVEGDSEELEYAAAAVAARASLRLLAREDTASLPRRVVLAADVPDGSARPAPDLDRAAVRLAGPLRVTEVVSALVDDVSATADVRRAAEMLPVADAGDDDAAFVVEGVEDHELGWYAAAELGPLVELEC